MLYGLIGEKLGHSFSKKVHALLGDYPYDPTEIKKDDLKSFLTNREFKGINVTAPYKQDVIPFLDFVSEEVKEIGACNTIVNKGGKLFGYNTDAYGLEMLIRKNGVSIQGRRCAILGTGGTSKTAFYVLKKLGASSVIKVSRTGKDGAVTYQTMPNDIEVIVNTTPCGTFPNNDESPIDLTRFKSLAACFDVVYNPLRTALVSQAKSLGIKAEGGLYMLVGQAIKASEYFLDTKYSDETFEKVFNVIFDKTQNVVLIGMPTSGKTTIGKKLAKTMDREFTDVDDCIEKTIGMSIPTYFEKFGEKQFRDIEEQIIAELSKKSGLVLATGGGSILREANVRRLKQNGVLCFLDRSLDKLQASSSRPLSSDKETLKKRYDERYSLYKAVADVVIDGNGTIEEALNKVKEKIL